jgi:hypothetical protein
MRAFLSGIFWLVCGAMACLCLVSPVLAAPAEPAHLTADRVHSTPDKLVAEGNVAVDIEGARLLCQRLEMDRTTGQITATRNCVFYYKDSFIAAESLTWEPQTRTAHMLKAAGQGRDFSMEGGSLDRDVFFWAEKVNWTTEKVELLDATFTTCDTPPGDWHYNFHSELVEIYPGDRLLASNTSFTWHGNRIATVPTLNLSLDPRDQRRRSQIPQVGSNSTDGIFVRSALDYAFDRDNNGRVLLDYYSKTGIGRGLEHFYTLGGKGEGSFYMYHQDGETDRARYEVRNDLYYRPDEYTQIAWNFNSNRTEIPGFESPDNLSSYLSATRYAPGSALQFSHNLNETGPDRNTTWRLSYNQELTPELLTLWSADLVTASTGFTRTERFHYLGGLRHVGELFDSELMVENTSGQQTFFMNRNPELSFSSRPLHLGPVPILAAASFGQVQESPSMFQTQRCDLRVQVPDQTLEYASGRFMVGGGLRQLFYGSGESQYVLATRAGWLQNLGEMGALRLDYNWQLPEGYTPFQHDFVYPFENLTGGLEISQADKFSVSILGGYDLRHDQFQSVTPRVDFRPGPDWRITAASSYDPNTSTWRNVDAGLKMQLTPGLSLSHWSVYDLVNSRLTYQDYQLNLEDHDSITSLVYRGVQNEFYLQFSLKAFPLQPVSIGPNTQDPILPQYMPNAFVR